MIDTKHKKLNSWLFVYATMIVAVVFATRSGAVAPHSEGALSPVVIDGEAPLLKVNPVVGRADL